ncbi:uncharacterized protein LOC133328199 [Musca vetustissima]|uniref:uncharacterized protein LOC133328199 n=1 Tax=Musca vetustissima TaxID=27455 RepID=UPI002AB623BB|nr:uncharacterized protein LOC133328199 [Musca vetustissima]
MSLNVPDSVPHLAPIHSKSNRQSAATHPGSSSGSSNGGHNLGLSPASSTIPHSVNTATLLSNAVSPSTSSSSSVGTAHLPTAQFVVNDKDAAVQEVLKHFSAAAAAAAASVVDDDLGDSYQIINDLKREVNPSIGQGPQTLPTPPPPPSSSSPGNVNYPWNMFERPSYYNPMPLPPMSPMAALFPHLFNPFESYHPSPFPVTPRFMPFMSYAQPILVPYPFYMAPEMFYPGYSAPSTPLPSEYEDSMSRGAGSGRRPSASSSTSHPSSSNYPRNSPIYYVRLPPTPYMFLPSLGLGAATSPGYSAMLPYQSLPSFPPFSPVFNVPINFLANGKPGNVYQIGGSPNDLQYPNVPPNYPSRVSAAPAPPPPPPPAHSFANGYRPTTSTHNYFNIPPSSGSSHNYASYSPPASQAQSPGPAVQHQPDSKLTSLKRPYLFNGRPEDIYILPNNFNPLYSSENSYY